MSVETAVARPTIKSLHGRSFLKELDFKPDELRALIDLSAELKAARKAHSERKRMAGKNIAIVFEKTSTRTRCAFEVAAYDQGAHVTYLGPDSSQIGHKESIRDTARVLGRMYDAIEYRGFGQGIVEELARYAGVPVYNGLSDEFHPTQMLADMLTMREHSGKAFEEISFCFLGDARFNTGNSLMITGCKLGMDVRICAPKSLHPTAEMIDTARKIAAETGAFLTVSEDIKTCVAGVDFLCTDVWVSMGEDKSVWRDRIALLKPYQVNGDVVRATGNPDVKFMHCLPAFHDRNTKVGSDIYRDYGLDALEVTDEVFESDRSIVFDEAENRLHTIKAVMVATIGEAA
ncbi:MAG TPA: ornithine carbamoyltransferase [Candidatus Dormibacteraeota bacterium]|nr:ornithine carbamoyltransferase [Candidatus Dormibacteraeota bacterium]